MCVCVCVCVCVFSGEDLELISCVAVTVFPKKARSRSVPNRCLSIRLIYLIFGCGHVLNQSEGNVCLPEVIILQ